MKIDAASGGTVGKNLDLTMFSAIHFTVDLCCIFMMTAFVVPLTGNRVEWIWCVVMYNLFAFAVQLPVGALGDRTGRPHRLAAIGCGLIIAAYGLLWAGELAGVENLIYAEGTLWITLAACVIAGIGNSCFHVGGGISTLEFSGGRAARPGIFVSTGAMGVYLAPKLAARNFGLTAGLAAGIGLMLVCGLLLAVADRKNRMRWLKEPYDADETAVSDVAGAGRETGRGLVIAGLICLLLTIVIRSYAGGLMGFAWKSVPLYGFLFAMGVVAGKFLGGILGDRLGWARTAAGSLLLSMVLLHLGGSVPACGIAGVLLFNMTMPLTLSAIAKAMGPGQKGTAFGMTTFALFLGTLPSVFGQALGWTGVVPEWLLPGMILISAGAVYFGVSSVQRN